MGMGRGATDFKWWCHALCASCSWRHLLTTLGNVCGSAVKSRLFQIKPTIMMENLNLRHVIGGGVWSGAEGT